MRPHKYLFSIFIGIIFILSLVSDWYLELSISLTLVLVFWILDKLGKGLVLRETVSLFYAVTCLIMPLVGYKYYGRNNTLSRIWVKSMIIPREAYFGYALPAIALFCFFLTFPLRGGDDDGDAFADTIARIRKQLSGMDRKLFLILYLAASLVFSFLTGALPDALQFVAFLVYISSFAILLYIYFSPAFNTKYWILVLFLVAIFVISLSKGMFTVLAFMSLAIFSFFFFGRRTSFIRKLVFFVAAIFFFIIFQNVKVTYRKYVWVQKSQENKALLFADLFVENLGKGSNLFDPRSFFPVYVRGNQGYFVALVMYRYPAVKPFDSGERLFQVLLSSLVPRLLWPDKPMAGGKFNMQYYAGRVISTYTVNVGPLGEAYGSFGWAGGILYMGILGFFIRWVYSRVFAVGRRYPLVILWIPVLFFQVSYSAENDTLQILNSLIKISVFIYLVFRIFPELFRVGRRIGLRRAVPAIS